MAWNAMEVYDDQTLGHLSEFNYYLVYRINYRRVSKDKHGFFVTNANKEVITQTHQPKPHTETVESLGTMVT